MDVSIEIELANKETFLAAVRRAKEQVGNLRVPLTLIAQDFYKSQKSIFGLKGPGQYQDITATYKKSKTRDVGFAYPLLRRSGFLERSVTSNSDSDSIYSVTKETLIIGTNNPYARFHQEGTSKMPRRPFFFIGPEAPKYATDETKGRLERWLGILDGYVKARLEADLLKGE